MPSETQLTSWTASQQDSIAGSVSSSAASDTVGVSLGQQGSVTRGASTSSTSDASEVSSSSALGLKVDWALGSMQAKLVDLLPLVVAVPFAGEAVKWGRGGQSGMQALSGFLDKCIWPFQAV